MNLKYISEFPISITLNKAMLKFNDYFNNKMLINKNRIKKDILIFDYLDNFYNNFHYLYVKEDKLVESKIVWIMWQQGFSNAPDVVKFCRESIYYQLPKDAEVIEITDKNLFDFISFPSFIIEKYKKGNISRAHFSDLVRIRLLATYGGIWLDATDFISRPVSEKIFEMPFFTAHGALHPDSLLPFLKGKWSIFAIGGCSQNIFHLIDNLLIEYWRRHDVAIDYWVTDYIINYAYTHYKFVKKLIDNCPKNNTKIHEVERLIREDASLCDFEDLLYHSDTYIHKLSYKSTVISPLSHGYQTFMKSVNKSWRK